MKSVSSERVLVVGGNGFIGERIVSALMAASYNVSVMDLFKPEQAPGHIDWIVGSASDEALLASAASTCQIVIFLAANSLPHSANADMAAEISSHVRMVVKAAEISHAQGVRKFLFASSGGTVYGPTSVPLIHEGCPCRPINAYGASKASIEMYLSVLRQTRGMHTTSLRIANPYGVGQRAHRGQGFVAAAMAAAIAGRTLPCWGDGSVVRDFVYVDDVADAFVAACMAPDLPQEINVGSGTGYKLSDVIKLVEEATRLPLVVDYQPNRSIDVKSNILDISLAVDVLGWSPKTSFRSGLEQTAAWWHKISEGADL